MDVILKKRFLAFIVDFVLITALMWILGVVFYPLLMLTGLLSIFNYWLIVLALLIIVYFTYLEGSRGQTLGKNIMGIEVISLKGNLNYKQTFIRNLSKILWFPLILDLLVGYFTKNAPLRFLDKIAKTEVVLSEK